MFHQRNGNPGYRVDSSVAVAEALDRLQRRATHRGQGEAFKSAFRRIAAGLRKSPLTLGEPLYSLKDLRLEVRTVVIAPLAIDFAVNEEHRIVWITNGRLLAKRES